jgi:murein DD-endopeptidase MepM/ murein hydrolase activator NlpD
MIPETSNIGPSMDISKPAAIAARIQAMFMEVMIKAMEETTGQEGGLFGSGASAEIYSGLFREHLGLAMSSHLRTPLQEELSERLTVTSIAPAPASQNQAPELPLPANGRVSSTPGWRMDPIDGTWRLHRGTDIAAPAGETVRAVESGRVIESGAKGSFGNTVVIESESGRRMLYAHNQENLVRSGDRVAAGQAIARVGATGRATGPHVHFEVLE